MYGAPLLVRGWSIMIHTLLSKFTPYGWRGGLERARARARAPMLSPSTTLSSLSLPERRTLLGLRRPPLALARISPPPSMAWEEDPKEAAISHSSKSDDKSLIIVSFYQFAKLSQYMEARKRLVEVCELNRVSGGVILAPEGINGSICGTRRSINKVLEAIQVELGLTNLRLTEAFAGSDDEVLIDGHHVKSPLSAGENAPFRWGHVRVKVKEEIVPLGIKGIDPLEKVGKYVQPKDWNTLICDLGTIIVDVRNAYETRIGKFRGALDPKTLSFKNFPVWAEHNLLPLYRPNVSQPNVEKSSLKDYKQNPHFSMIGDMMSSTDSITLEESPATKYRVATYCTGGIRCEKATSLLLAMGFKEVYHLEGGILRYLEEIRPTESLWEGECFVFDKRVSVGHGLKIGSYELCYACKKPVSETDKMSIYWEDGISCPYCFFQKPQIERDRARARQTQFEKCGVIGGPEKGKKNSF